MVAAVIVGSITVTVIWALLTRGGRSEPIAPIDFHSLENSKTGCSVWLLVLALFVVGAFVMALLRQ